jgi:protein-S-isoprenylcysteine O-methyltransferase Ste14
MAAIKLVLFAVFSAILVAIFWGSLRSWRLHGFFRFFAFESLLAMILLNAERWFRHPFSLIQIASWILLFSSILLALHGFRLLRILGQPEGQIENTTILVTSGAYHYIRHPLYCSLILLGLGIYLKNPSAIGTLLLVVLGVSLYATGRVEESENLRKFGDEYARYLERTKMFIPFLF